MTTRSPVPPPSPRFPGLAATAAASQALILDCGPARLGARKFTGSAFF